MSLNSYSDAELDRRIEIQRKNFYQTLMAKKRKIRRTWMEISCLTNAHILQTLPYRAMLGHVVELATERENARMLLNSSTSQYPDNDHSNTSGSSCDTGTGCYDLNTQTDEEVDEGIEEEATSQYSDYNRIKMK